MPVKSFLAAAAFAALAAGARGGLLDPEPAVGPPKRLDWFTVDLDQAPKDRWTALLHDKKNATLNVLNYVFGRIPEAIRPLLLKVVDGADHFWPLQIREELQGVADALGVDVAEVFAMNLFYELNSGCTSIVAQHEDGTFYHGRNLDYGVPGLQEIAVNVNFTSKGNTAYMGTTYAGYIGLLTGMKPNAFSLSVDERDTKNGTVWDNAFEAIFEGGHSIGFFFRETLETAADFDAALPLLQTTHMDSPSYMIIGGAKPGEGAVVTRERNVAVNTRTLRAADPVHRRRPGEWFLVETNYDWWVPPPAHDDRRDPAITHMNASSPAAINDTVLLGVMSAFPNLNSETTYTAIMSAAGNDGKGIYYGFTQNNNKGQ